VPRFQRVERLDASNLRAYARGCAILGSGGGGDVGTCLLQALQAVQDFGSVPVVGLEDLPDDALVVPCGAIGAPTVSFEKFESGEEGRVLEEVVEELTGARVAALMAGEIGGGNGLARREGLGPTLPGCGPGHAHRQRHHLWVRFAVAGGLDRGRYAPRRGASARLAHSLL